ncbi:MAG: dipeptide epimerase, partial [Haliscomenobacter sp.]
MKIKSLRVYSRNLALTKPYTIALRTIADVENVFLEVELENGVVGIGAANPAPEVVGESPAETLVNAQSEFFTQLAGRDIRHFKQCIYECRQQFPDLPGTQALLDIALHDAFGQYLGVPVAGFYGKKMDALPTSVTIGILPLSETLEAASDYLKMGFRIIKVKLGMDLEGDIERMFKLRERF